jgi:hypothetical protein
MIRCFTQFRYFQGDLPMRALVLALLVVALPATAMAQTTKIILTNQEGIKFQKKDGDTLVPFAPKQDEGGYEVSASDDSGVTVKTWYGDLVVTGAKPVSPTDAIDDLTEQIEKTPTDRTSDEHLASLYKYRGIAWRAKLKDENAVKAIAKNTASRFGNAAVGAGIGFPLMAPPDASIFTGDDLPVGNDVRDFTNSLRLNPRQADVYIQRGLSQLQNLRFAKDVEDPIVFEYYQDALSDFDRALRINEKSAWAYYWRGDTRLKYWKSRWVKITKDFNDSKPAGGNAKNDKEKATDDPVTVAQNAVTAAQAAFNQADQDYAKAKDAWTLAGASLAAANRDYFTFAADAYRRADKEFVSAKTTWILARDKLNAMNRASTKANDDKTKKDNAKPNTCFDIAEQPFEVAIIDLRDSLSDFSKAVRLEPAAGPHVAATRQKAENKLQEARGFQKAYNDIKNPPKPCKAPSPDPSRK